MADGDGPESGRLPRIAGARRLLEPALLIVTALALTAGGIAWLMGSRTAAEACWAAGTVVAVIPARGLGR